MKLYVVSEYVGGTPMDSGVIGVYDSEEKAKEAFKKRLDYLEVENMIEEYNDSYAYWDSHDYWGGLEIDHVTLNK